MMRSFLALGALLTLLLPSEAATRPATRTDDDGWVITARNPTGDYHAAAVANGELGVTVGRELFSLGQLLLGDASESGTAASVSRILEGINPLGLSLRIDAGRSTTPRNAPNGSRLTSAAGFMPRFTGSTG